MVGQIRFAESRRDAGLSVLRYGPLQVVEKRLCLPQGVSEAGIRRAVGAVERSMGRKGIGQVILPQGGVCRSYLRRLRPVEVAPFYRSCADLLVLGYLDSRGILPGRCRVALSAGCLGVELRHTAERLCPHVRELVIRVPGGGEHLARQLHECFGMPILPPDAEAELSVCFSPGEQVGERAFHLYGEMPQLLGMKMELSGFPLPEDCGQELLSLLWQRGWADRRRLKATICPQTLVNAGELCYNN